MIQPTFSLRLAAGVPCVPGYHKDNQDPNFLFEQAQRIGFPVLIKAVHGGGGGKGMRTVTTTTAEAFHEAMTSAKRESLKSFSNDTVFADALGGVVSLWERDCSVKRRNQKIIEEVAADNPLPLEQSTVPLVGHTFETRIYSENPRNNFLPDSGPLVSLDTETYIDHPLWRHSKVEPSVRLVQGFTQGYQIGVFYDPTIAKLIVHGKDRTEALRMLRKKALDEYHVVVHTPQWR
ncbi:rudiment single hybrid motif-containing protein, partial [Dendrothele bispora CBS 962.96]